MICGGDVFCLDGECDKATSGKSNDFGQAVSELAALATAGKDVAALNGVDVRAFTGKAKFCKKFAAGFSNCCKDSGWGRGCGAGTLQQRGKGAGQSEKDKLTVSIGEFCSKRFWGFCTGEKKELLPVRLKTGADRSAAGKKWSVAYRFWRRQQS